MSVFSCNHEQEASSDLYETLIITQITASPNLRRQMVWFHSTIWNVAAVVLGSRSEKDELLKKRWTDESTNQLTNQIDEPSVMLSAPLFREIFESVF